MAFLWNNGFFWKYFCLKSFGVVVIFPRVLPLKNELPRKCFNKNVFHFICIFGHFCCARFHSFPFSFLTDFDFIFCWSSKKPWDRSGGILVFKVVFLFKAFQKKSVPEINFQFYLLKSNYNRGLDASGLAESNFNNTPYSVREWCRFFTKLLSLLSKSDCFQHVSFGAAFPKTL